ncbi:UDP-3-O-(3-hydroxymyristoyl)glucosamine N-acyltransferase [Sphaerotilus sp.]|uniref:UDP-3-O-(3-hydroxymyristoyl)glucosamine N-acyltransferase n=1 Tax=Sphaerotilus sp. TaxID=2093942 RepID=UPI002ACED84E|nr:UDP-3-O-(3-hydroxymyristoyl)glucosamine N-acyltransferase [Sphaerotilus sp.]MDZ7858517.1 UDP-3-O-(3-hydroxymyristoyl)glucosamine N-acyltransferase [Sphaerotilus sp.]
MSPVFSVRLHEVQAALGGDLVSNDGAASPGDRLVHRIGPLDSADATTIAFLSNPRYRAQLQETGAGCVIVAPAVQDGVRAGCVALVTPDPYLYFARLTQWWAARTRAAAPVGVHSSAVVAPDAVLGQGVSIGPLAVVESGAVIGHHAVVGAHAFVGAGVEIGEASRLAPRVTLMPGTRLGARCLLHSGVVIGADGFGFAPTQGRWEKIEQLGGVRIGDDVEIGANTCIDRGALDDTVIGAGVKLDNLIQIGHNVQIGDHSAMAGCVGIAGSARIGSGCTVGGGAIVLGHLALADGVHISAASVVMRSIAKPGQYSGVFPLDDNASWEKNAATLRQLHTLRDRLRALEKKMTP